MDIALQDKIIFYDFVTPVAFIESSLTVKGGRERVDMQKRATGQELNLGQLYEDYGSVYEAPAQPSEPSGGQPPMTSNLMTLMQSGHSDKLIGRRF